MVNTIFEVTSFTSEFMLRMRNVLEAEMFFRFHIGPIPSNYLFRLDDADIQLTSDHRLRGGNLLQSRINALHISPGCITCTTFKKQYIRRGCGL